MKEAETAANCRLLPHSATQTIKQVNFILFKFKWQSHSFINAFKEENQNQ